MTLISRDQMPASTPYEQELRERLASAEQQLDDALKKIGMLMQPRPEDVPGDFPWGMMRLWVANRDEEKRAAHSTIATLLEHLALAKKERDQLGAMCAAYEDKFKMQREVVCAAREWRKEPIGERANELEAAVDALDEWAQERAKEVAQTAGSFTCPTCGPHVKADEDGFCVMCGEDCKMEGA